MILLVFGIIAATLASILFATFSYALRDYSRARLEDYLNAYGKSGWLERTVKHSSELVFVTAVLRVLANILIVLGTLNLFEKSNLPKPSQYLAAVGIVCAITLFFSIALPMALAHHLGELIIAVFVRPLHAMRVGLLPLVRLMRLTDRLVFRWVGRGSEHEPEQIEKDILSVVEEGEKEGVVDTQERKMIESVIEFRDTQAGQTMTARPEIVALEMSATLDEVKQTLEESGHSRIPVYDGTLDHIVGILYARDLLKHLGSPPEQFDIRTAIRPAIFVPRTKPLRDLLREFRIQKVHIAIVLDEYGGTAGLVTIEDILEELVGDISDEHEPRGQAMLNKINDRTFEVDARLFIGDANKHCGLNLPEDAGYDTLGGFVSMTLGRIPAKGISFESGGARYTILDAEPQRVKRLKIEIVQEQVQEVPSH
jgi:putative hemolysin